VEFGCAVPARERPDQQHDAQRQKDRMDQLQEVSPHTEVRFILPAIDFGHAMCARYKACTERHS